MDTKELLGSAMKEAQKHPELLASVVGFVQDKATGSAKAAPAKKAPAGSKSAKRPPKEDEGGLMGLLGNLDVAGLAEQASSWVGTGPNEKVSGKKIEQALGSKKVEAAAKRAGVSKEEAADGIAQLLPAVVDYLTPDGKVPTKKQAAKRLKVLTRRETATKEGGTT
jgi:uncharacterized protein YidB (DUF937 family)